MPNIFDASIDLRPYTELLEKYRNSHFSTVFIWGCMDEQFEDLHQYVFSLLGISLLPRRCTVWIRASTGRLCVDISPPEANGFPLGFVDQGFRPAGTSICEPPADSETIASISLQDYHEICYWHLCQEHCWLVSTNVAVGLGSIWLLSGPENVNSWEVAYHDCEFDDLGWSMRDPNQENYWPPISCSIIVNGWIRINSAEVVNEYWRRMYTNDASHWLMQANDIFSSLDLTSGFEHFVVVDTIRYWLELSVPTNDLPPGYLFLCPLAELQAEVLSRFRIPERPAYWSLDPSGVDRLSTETAEDMGFPAIQSHILVSGKSWDVSVYDGICQFHEAKGFNPYSCEVTLELGCPPFQLSCDRDTLLAHLQECADDCHSNSDEFSSIEDFSKSRDEQSKPEFDSGSCNRMEDHTREHMPPTDEGPSEIPEISVPSSYQYCGLEAAEMLPLSRSCTVVMAVQIVLILAATALSLYD